MTNPNVYDNIHSLRDDADWGTLVIADGDELIMRDTKENVLRRLWAWNINEVELLWRRGGGELSYTHLMRGNWTDTDGCLWQGWIVQHDSEFPNPGCMLLRQYVPKEFGEPQYDHSFAV